MSLAGILSIVADDPRLREAFEIGATQTGDAEREGGPGPARLEGLDLVAPPALRPVLTAALAARLGPFALSVTVKAVYTDVLHTSQGTLYHEYLAVYVHV